MTFEEYQTRLKSIRTPEDAAALAKEFAAVAMAAVPKPEPKEEPAPKAYAKRRLGAPAIDRDDLAFEPWYDVVANDNEAMVISLYAKGLTTRDISRYMKAHHGLDISQPGVSSITDKVFPLVKEWQARPLSAMYPIVYLDGIHFKVRDAGKIASKVAYIALGINPYGIKEVLGIWVTDSEGAKYWMHILNDLKNRGVDDILIACVDGLKGFPEAIKAVYPNTDVQVCIAHQIRNTMKFLPFHDREAFCKDLKLVYTAANADAGREALDQVKEKWPQYRPYLRSWEEKWSDLATFFEYPAPVRRMIYTTNMIENLNRQFRKVTKTTNVFPHDDSLVKLLWLAQSDFSKARSVALRNWSEIMAQLSVLFEDRVRF
ncbi:IS256 family transposase [Patescibacteria group bacterium]|nr:IS256 family transposase [Patescibacteria group bacterium]